MIRNIIIHYDFHDGSELSFQEGLRSKEDFTTCVLDFFKLGKNVKLDNVTVLRQDGHYINNFDLLANDGKYTPHEITIASNIKASLLRGEFNWKDRDGNPVDRNKLKYPKLDSDPRGMRTRR